MRPLRLALLFLALLPATAQAQGTDPAAFDSAARWRALVVGGASAPAVGPASPLIAMVDARADLTHPALAGSNVTSLGAGPVTFVEGTANAAAAAGVGAIEGIWPGARCLNVPLPDDFRCADTARGVRRAIGAGAAVIAIGFGAPVPCRPATQAMLRAVDRDIVVVASGGVDREEGSPPWFPADLPHVLTVGAIRADLAASDFSSRSAMLDVMAPGWRVLTARPISLDPNGDGFTLVSGTGIAAAMTAAAVAWLRAERPGLDAGQVAAVIRGGAFDADSPGRDDGTGDGVVSIPGALAAPIPPRDPAEPNDDIAQVDGTLLGHRGAALRPGGAVRAGLDFAEDPVDVYRLALPPGARVHIRLEPRAGDPDLIVFGGRARTVSSGGQLKRSHRRGRQTDGVTLRNRRSVTRHVYVGVGFTKRATRARYALSVRQQSAPCSGRRRSTAARPARPCRSTTPAGRTARASRPAASPSACRCRRACRPAAPSHTCSGSMSPSFAVPADRGEPRRGVLPGDQLVLAALAAQQRPRAAERLVRGGREDVPVVARRASRRSRRT